MSKRAAVNRNKFVSSTALSRNEINEILTLRVVTGFGSEMSSVRPRSDVWNYFGCFHKTDNNNVQGAAATGDQQLRKIGESYRFYCSKVRIK